MNKFQPSGGDKSLKKQTLKRGAISAALSPGSASSVRQSPRLKVYINQIGQFCFLNLLLSALCVVIARLEFAPRDVITNL